MAAGEADLLLRSHQELRPVHRAHAVVELRAKLRPLFDKFDVDGSGSISVVEMTGIITQLKIKMSPEQIHTMMKERPPTCNPRSSCVGVQACRMKVRLLTLRMQKTKTKTKNQKS